jgi:hypothetical protein
VKVVFWFGDVFVIRVGGEAFSCSVGMDLYVDTVVAAPRILKKLFKVIGVTQ